MAPVRRTAFHAAPVPLPLDHLRHVARDLADQQAHRDVGEGEADAEGYGKGEKDDDERCESRHLLSELASALPAKQFQAAVPEDLTPTHSRTCEMSWRMSNGLGSTRNTGFARTVSDAPCRFAVITITRCVGSG